MACSLARLSLAVYGRSSLTASLVSPNFTAAEAIEEIDRGSNGLGAVL
jgi:hypothetical protein